MASLELKIDKTQNDAKESVRESPRIQGNMSHNYDKNISKGFVPLNEIEIKVFCVRKKKFLE